MADNFISVVSSSNTQYVTQRKISPGSLKRSSLIKPPLFSETGILFEYYPQAGDTLKSIAERLCLLTIKYMSSERLYIYLQNSVGKRNLKEAINKTTIEVPGYYLDPTELIEFFPVQTLAKGEKDICLHMPVYILENEEKVYDYLKKAFEAGFESIMADIKNEGGYSKEKYIMWRKLATLAKRTYGMKRFGGRIVLFRNVQGYIDPQKNTAYVKEMLDLIDKYSKTRVFDFLALDYIRFKQKNTADYARVEYISYQVFLPILYKLYENDYQGELQLFVYGDVSKLVDPTIRNIGQDARFFQRIYEVFDMPGTERKFIKTEMPVSKTVKLVEFVMDHSDKYFFDKKDNKDQLVVIGEVTKEEDQVLKGCFKDLKLTPKKVNLTNLKSWVELSRVASEVTARQKNYSKVTGKKKFKLGFKSMAYGGTHVDEEERIESRKIAEETYKYTGTKKFVFSNGNPLRNYPAQANALYTYPLLNYLKDTNTRMEISILGNNHKGTLEKHGAHYLLWQAVSAYLMTDGVYFFNPPRRDLKYRKYMYAAARLCKDYYEYQRTSGERLEKELKPLKKELRRWLNKNRDKYQKDYPFLY